MHMGLQLLVSFFGSGGSAATDTKKDRRASALSPDERVLYDKIVKDLYDAASEDLAPKSDAPSANYAIIFRQAESWGKVEKMLEQILAASPEFDTEVWAEKWLQRISDLRGLQKRVHDAGKEILLLKSQGVNNSDTLIANYRKSIASAKTRIQEHLDTAKNELKSIDNGSVKGSVDAARTLAFIKENWLHLTVFSEWLEVPMDCGDKKRLFVQIRQPRSIKVDEAIFLNQSTKAIFTVQEITGDKCKEVGMVRQCIGPASPSPIRRTSSVILTAESFFNHEFVAVDGKMKTEQPERSSMGDRLHFIVNIALDEVNAQLARAQCRELSPPSSASEGIRMDWFFTRPLFGASSK